MRIVIIGAVAAGTSAATKARRNDKNAEIVLYDKDKHISYSGCGLPYYIGGKIEDMSHIVPRNAYFFKDKYNIGIKTEHEVLSINTEQKFVLVKDLTTGNTFEDYYDKLLITTGASPFIPKIEGVNSNNVFHLRNVQDAVQIKTFIQIHKPRTAVIAGTGLIGLELLESLTRKNIDVTMVEVADKITPNLDYDMAEQLEKILTKKNVRIIKNAGITRIAGKNVTLSNNQHLNSDMVIIAAGVRPNTKIAKEAGIEPGLTGAIKVDKHLQTNIKDIYACGDCAETFSAITGKPVYTPLGSTANKTGRIAGDVLTGVESTYKGNLGTGIFKLFDLAIATTGLSEKEAITEGFDIITNTIKVVDKPEFFDGEDMNIKAIADKKTKRLLGVQIIGKSGVDKRIDVFATLITYKATIDEIFNLDLAYSPPFSTPKDPVHYTGMVLESEVNKANTSAENVKASLTDTISAINNIDMDIIVQEVINVLMKHKK